MTFGRLVWKDLSRNPLRLGLTVVAAAVGVLSFVFLQTVVDIFHLGVAGSQSDRLIVRNRTSFTQPLPLSYLERIAALPDVKHITFQGWFGGRLSERVEDQFPNFYVDKTQFLEVYDEYLLSADELAGFLKDPCGAVVGQALAERYGWKVGDRVVLEGTLFPGEWPMTVRGIYRGKYPSTDTTVLAFGYRCVNERLPADRQDKVGIFSLTVTDPSRSAPLASHIDRMFENSPFETRTESEKSFQLGFLAMTQAILVAVQVVSYVVLAIVLLVVANTLMMGVRDRRVDLATLKALGFADRKVAFLVLWEALVVGGLAALLGVLAAPALIRLFLAVVASQFGPVQAVAVRPATLLISCAASLLVALLAALVPAFRAARLPVAEGLRKVV